MYIKVLDAENKPIYGKSTFLWPLPTLNDDGTWTPGEWTKPLERTSICNYGYHYTDEKNVLEWIGWNFYELEIHPDAKAKWENTKGVCTCARLTRKLGELSDADLRLFAVDCARRVGHLSGDDETFNGVLDICVAHAVYGDTWDAARSAAWYAAWSAARSAARDAAWSAARSTARSAARDAARDAAWSAARSAARDAAWSAARSAAREYQNELLWRYINGEQGPLI